MSESRTVVGCNCLCCQTEREKERERERKRAEEAGDVSPNLRKSPLPFCYFWISVGGTLRYRVTVSIGHKLTILNSVLKEVLIDFKRHVVLLDSAHQCQYQCRDMSFN